MAIIKRASTPRPQPNAMSDEINEPGHVKCDSCTLEGTGFGFMKRVIEGLDVICCTDPMACRLRAQALSIWCTYP